MNKTELKKYWGLRQELGSLDRQMHQIQQDMSSVQAQRLSHMPRPDSRVPSDDKLVKLIMKLAEMQIRYNEKWDKVIDQMTEVENVIESLADPVERVLMRHRYLEGKRWEDICVEMNYSWPLIHRIHGRVLRKLEINV